MKLENLIAILGLLISLAGAKISNGILITIGSFLCIYYFKISVEKNIQEKIIEPIKNQENKIEKISKDINNLKEKQHIMERIARLEGQMNQKGNINPFNYLLLVLGLVILVLILKELGIF